MHFLMNKRLEVNMKHNLCWCVRVVLLSFVCSCMIIVAQHTTQDAQATKHYQVYINDVPVNYFALRTSEPPQIMLPFLALVESLGGTISWQNDTVACLSFAGKTWEFDFEHVRLCSIGSSSNLLCPPPGSTEGIHIIKSEREAYIDSSSLGFVLYNYLCVKMVDINDAQQVVRIYTK